MPHVFGCQHDLQHVSQLNIKVHDTHTGTFKLRKEKRRSIATFNCNLID